MATAGPPNVDDFGNYTANISQFQPPGSTTSSNNGGIIIGSSSPTDSALPGSIYFDTVAQVFWTNTDGTSGGWVLIPSGGGGAGGGLTGSGSPQGVVTAKPGSYYYDTSGSTFWVKATGTGNTGWQQLI